jgi:hypothetical protein
MRAFLALGLLITLCGLSVRRRSITRGTMSSFVPARTTPSRAGPTQRLGRRSTTTTRLATTIRQSWRRHGLPATP